MVTVYFITILVITTNTIPEGWLQWTKPYTSKPECEFVIMKEHDQLADGVKLYLKNKLAVVKKIECLTYDETIKRNSALGH